MSTPIIAGSVGGAAVVFIIILCVVILYARQSRKKKSHEFDNNMIEITSDIKMNTNYDSLYSSIKQSRTYEDQYDYVSHDNISLQNYAQNTIKVDTNPSYGRVQGCITYDIPESEYDAAIQPNPLCSSISKETIQLSEFEDQDGYVETNSLSMQKADYLKIIGPSTKEEESIYDNDTDETDNIKVNPNPSYDSVSDVKLEDNPSYSKIIKHA